MVQANPAASVQIHTRLKRWVENGEGALFAAIYESCPFGRGIGRTPEEAIEDLRANVLTELPEATLVWKLDFVKAMEG